MCIYIYVFYNQIENPCTLYKIFRRAYKFSKNSALSLSVLTVGCHSQCSIQIFSPEQSSCPSNHMLNNVYRTITLEAGHTP